MRLQHALLSTCVNPSNINTLLSRAAGKMTNINIDVTADLLCPWCYIGKGRLEKAIDLYKSTVPGGDQDTFTVTWHSFYMNAGLPKKGIDSMADFRRQYGDATANMLAGRVQAIGEAEGLNLRNIGKRGHTKNAHRLIQLGRSKSPEMQNRVVTELYKSYWGEDGDITDFGMLTECGVKAGLDRDEVKKWLEGGEGGAEVDKEVRDALRKGIHAVPNYNINGEYSLDGAQEPQTFVQAFVKAKNSENPNVSAGGSCPID